MILRIIKYLLPLVSILFIFLDANATNCVSSVNAYQEGKNIVITYQLSKQTDIKVSVSTDGGKNYSTLKKVIGDVGKDIKKGDKNITWRVLDEFEKFDYDNVCFKVEEYFTENGHEYVDLGLPSGTLWATCNVGAKSPEDYGDNFAWGETTTKTTFDDETYKWKNGYIITKYCVETEIIYSRVDYRATLELADDAANANWGGRWRMPTRTEIEELKEYCTFTYGEKNEVYGHTVTGPNGNSIFLVGVFYWSSSLYKSESLNAYILNPSPTTAVYYFRSFGLPVRPVMSRKNSKSYQSK